MNRPEEGLQRAVVAYLRLALPIDCYWFAVPNQRGTRKQFENQLLVALGVRAGVPDLILLYRGRLIAIELKAAKGARSPAQITAAYAIIEAGGACFLCRSLEAVEQVLLEQAVPLRGRLSPGGGVISEPERRRA